MSDSIDVAIGVFEGKVVAQWKDPTASIAFDPKNAYMVGMALSKAAMEAHRGSKNGEDVGFLADELTTEKKKVSDLERMALVMQVSTIIRTLIDQKRTPGYIAQHCVDTVLAETAR